MAARYSAPAGPVRARSRAPAGPVQAKESYAQVEIKQQTPEEIFKDDWDWFDTQPYFRGKASGSVVSAELKALAKVNNIEAYTAYFRIRPGNTLPFGGSFPLQRKW